MRKTFTIITVVAIILSVVGTGIIVFVETANQPEQATVETEPASSTAP